MSTAKLVYPLATILRKAWCLARSGARTFGGPARAYLAQALRTVWAEQKALRARILAQRAAVAGFRAIMASDAADIAAWEAAYRPRHAMPATPAWAARPVRSPMRWSAFR